MLKYGIYAKAVELLCFKSALARLAEINLDMDMKDYKKKVKREFKAMLLRTPDIGGSYIGQRHWHRGMTAVISM